jgi:acetyl coenzyme A synthetase (ADP forming)-like protein
MQETKAKATLDAIFRPANIAIIGASKKPGKIGSEIVRNLFGYEFNGTIFPVNAGSRFIHSTKSYPSLSDIPDPVDLAVIAVPKQAVLGVVEECRAKGVRGLVIITAGFKETGEKGAVEERELRQIVKDAGMIAVGPNCMGVINTEAAFRMNATFGPRYVLPGNVSFLSQSGALGVVLIEQASEIGMGLRMFVSQGNRMDASANQFLEYWHEDEGTDVILMYIESFGSPRAFPRVARKVARDKPVVVLKSGRSSAGARAASSHTGAMAGTDAAYDALFKQCGVLRASSIEELFDIGKAFASGLKPGGPRAAILTNAGGPAIMAADACCALGLVLPDLSAETTAALAGYLPPEAAIANPVDMIASATPESYRFCMQELLKDPVVDSLVVVFVAPPTTDPTGVLQAIADVYQEKQDKPIIVCLMGRLEDLRKAKVLADLHVPVYVYPESSARALAALVEREKWLNKPQGTSQDFAVDRPRARAIVEQAAARGDGYLYDDETAGVLAAYGIPFTDSIRCLSEDEAVLAADRLGLPVVMKVSSPKITHKSDAGGVFINLRSELEVRGAYHQIMSAAAKVVPDLKDVAVLVQELVPQGQETIIGMSMDPNFGPLIMFGAGGVHVEVLKDVVFRLCPVTDVDAREMIEELRSYPLLNGYRGSEPANLEFLSEMLQRVSILVSDLPQIVEMDLNPTKVFAERERCRILDARIRVSP